MTTPTGSVKCLGKGSTELTTLLVFQFWSGKIETLYLLLQGDEVCCAAEEFAGPTSQVSVHAMGHAKWRCCIAGWI